MSPLFPRSGKSKLGYTVADVDRFLNDARVAYESQGEPGRGEREGDIDSRSIRRASFSLEKDGYATAPVDAALERLEDAFSARERQRVVQEIGDQQWFAQSRDRAREILARLERPSGRRFQRAGALVGGYHRDDVDDFCDVLVSYFRSGAKVTVEDVRSVVFRPKLGGYSEAQVDLVLDAVVDVMLSVR